MIPENPYRLRTVREVRELIRADARVAALFRADNPRVDENESAVSILDAVAAKVRAFCEDEEVPPDDVVRAFATEADWVSTVVLLEASTFLARDPSRDSGRRSAELAERAYRAMGAARPTKIKAVARNLRAMRSLQKNPVTRKYCNHNKWSP